MVIDELPYAYAGHSVVEWHGQICQSENIPSIAGIHTIFAVDSAGGFNVGLPSVEASFDRAAAEYHARTGERLQVWMGECNSLCVDLLAHLNHQARLGRIDLRLKQSGGVEIHGASYNGEVYSPLATEQMNENMIREGASRSWLSAHAAYFRLFGAQEKSLPYVALAGSGLTDSARLIDSRAFDRARRQETLRYNVSSWLAATHTIDTSSGECPPGGSDNL